MLTHEQQSHINTIVSRAAKKIYNKYERGAEEHGGDLWDHSMMWFVDQMIAEAIDQLIYALTLKQKLQEESPDGIKPPWEITQ